MLLVNQRSRGSCGSCVLFVYNLLSDVLLDDRHVSNFLDVYFAMYNITTYYKVCFVWLCNVSHYECCTYLVIDGDDVRRNMLPECLQNTSQMLRDKNL